MSDEGEILCEFECPICFQFMHPPIHICQKGHCMCKHCKSKIRVCPQCRDAVFYRCYVLEKIHSKLKFPCKYAKEGCLITTYDFPNIEEHENLCLYNSTRPCPLAQHPCNWNGKYAEMPQHIEDEHSSLIATEDKLGFVLSNSSAIKTEVVFIEKYDNMFQTIINKEKDISRIVVQYVGCPAEAERYAYKIEIVKNEKKSLVQTESCEKLEYIKTAFDHYKGVIIFEGKLKQFYDANTKLIISILSGLK